MMSNASLFRRTARAEELMMAAVMPKAAAAEPKPQPERVPETLTVSLAALVAAAGGVR